MECLYLGGALIHRGRRVEFIYPMGLRWSCTRCGRCCRDTESHERRVLLTDTDIRRIEEAGAEKFHEATGEERFTGLMRMSGGACIFLTPQGCSIYGARALLCRTYPFWIEKMGDAYVFHADHECPGLGGGPELGETFYRGLLGQALDEAGP